MRWRLIPLQPGDLALICLMSSIERIAIRTMWKSEREQENQCPAARLVKLLNMNNPPFPEQLHSTSELLTQFQ